MSLLPRSRCRSSDPHRSCPTRRCLVVVVRAPDHRVAVVAGAPRRCTSPAAAPHLAARTTIRRSRLPPHGRAPDDVRIATRPRRPSRSSASLQVFSHTHRRLIAVTDSADARHAPANASGRPSCAGAPRDVGRPGGGIGGERPARDPLVTPDELPAPAGHGRVRPAVGRTQGPGEVDRAARVEEAGALGQRVIAGACFARCTAGSP